MSLLKCDKGDDWIFLMSEQEGKILFERSLICSGFRLYNETGSDLDNIIHTWVE